MILVSLHFDTTITKLWPVAQVYSLLFAMQSLELRTYIIDHQTRGIRKMFMVHAVLQNLNQCCSSHQGLVYMSV